MLFKNCCMSRYFSSPLSTVLFTHPKTNTIVQSPDNYVLGQNRELLLNQNSCSKPSPHKNVLRLKITSKESIRLLLNESKTFVFNDSPQCDSSCAPSNKHRHPTKYKWLKNKHFMLYSMPHCIYKKYRNFSLCIKNFSIGFLSLTL